MIIDPWGRVLGRASDQEGVVTAPIDLHYLDRIRNELPALYACEIESLKRGMHMRKFSGVYRTSFAALGIAIGSVLLPPASRRHTTWPRWMEWAPPTRAR